MRTEDEIQQELEYIINIFVLKLSRLDELDGLEETINSTQKRCRKRELERKHPDWAQVYEAALMRGKFDALNWVLGETDELYKD